MKKIMFVLFLMFFVAMTVVAPVRAFQGETGTEITDPVQLFIIGTVASVIVYFIKLLSARLPDVNIKREWLTIFLYLISVVLATLWRGITLPIFELTSDPVAFVGNVLRWLADVLVAIGPVVGWATLIYNVLLARVLDGLAHKVGWK